MPLLRVDRLALMYGATEVLSDLTFQVEPRERLGIVGANGSGKSSLLKAISGDVIATAGALSPAAPAPTPHPGQEVGGGPPERVHAHPPHSTPALNRLPQRPDGLGAALAP